MASNPKDPKAETAAATGAAAVAPHIKGDKTSKEKEKEKDGDKGGGVKEKEGDKNWAEKSPLLDQKLQKDTKDTKDQKEQKDYKDPKEHKDFKDHKEQKDQKEHKDQIKEHKDQIKEKPETKEFQKEFDQIGRPESPLGQVNLGDPAIRPDIEQRLAALEGKVATFIPDSSRPDLRAGALKNEPDQSGGGQGSGG
jgi:cobalamin biosynthesis protein CobT